MASRAQSPTSFLKQLLLNPETGQPAIDYLKASFAIWCAHDHSKQSPIVYAYDELNELARRKRQTISV